jgi:hypothetical protein
VTQTNLFGLPLASPPVLSKYQQEFEARLLGWESCVSCQHHPIPAIIDATYTLLGDGWRLVRREYVEGYFRDRSTPTLRISKLHGDATYYFRIISLLEPSLRKAYPENPLRTGKYDDPAFTSTYMPDLSKLGYDDYIPLGEWGWGVSVMPAGTLFAEVRRRLGESHEVFGGVKTATGEFDFQSQGSRIDRIMTDVVLKTGATLTRVHPPVHWRNPRGFFYEAQLKGDTYLQGGDTEAEAMTRLWLNMQARNP